VRNSSGKSGGNQFFAEIKMRMAGLAPHWQETPEQRDCDTGRRPEERELAKKTNGGLRQPRKPPREV